MPVRKKTKKASTKKLAKSAGKSKGKAAVIVKSKTNKSLFKEKVEKANTLLRKTSFLDNRSKAAS